MYEVVILVIFAFAAVNGSREFIDIFPKIPNVVESGSNELCINESKLYSENLKNRTLWAYQMLDSSAKSTTGVLQGNSIELGNYKECLGITGPFPTQHCIITVNMYVPVINTTQEYSEDQYGSVFIKFQKPYLGRSQTRLGLCLPASCSVLDIESFLTEYLTAETSIENRDIGYNLAKMKEYMCTNKLHPNTFGTPQILFCILCAFLVVLLVVVTIIDFNTKDENEDFLTYSKTKRILFSFSARRTWKILFGAKKNHNKLEIFHGVKVIAQLFIIFGHVGYVSYAMSWIEVKAIEDFTKSHMIYIFSQLTLFLDLFFLISGLFLSYGILTKMKESKINIIVVLLLRYCRLTPINAFITFYFVCMLGFSGTGPAWNLITKPTIDNCMNNWWTNILYVNNLVIGVDGLCNSVAWYIAADFQLFIMGALLMYLVGRYQRVGYGILICLLVLSILPPFLLSYFYNFTKLSIIKVKSKDYSNLLYVKPYTYATAYIIGLIGGILYDRFKSQNVKISKEHSRFIFGISMLLIIVAFGYPILFNTDHENYIFENPLYNAVYRKFWSIGFLGTFITASFGTATLYGSFLSCRIWIPFSKLTYGIYLVQWAVLLIYFGSSTNILQITVFDIGNLYIVVTVVSISASFVLYFFIEMPLIKVFTIILVTNNKNKNKYNYTKCNIENYSLQIIPDQETDKIDQKHT